MFGSHPIRSARRGSGDRLARSKFGRDFSGIILGLLIHRRVSILLSLSTHRTENKNLKSVKKLNFHSFFLYVFKFHINKYTLQKFFSRDIYQMTGSRQSKRDFVKLFDDFATHRVQVDAVSLSTPAAGHRLVSAVHRTDQLGACPADQKMVTDRLKPSLERRTRTLNFKVPASCAQWQLTEQCRLSRSFAGTQNQKNELPQNKSQNVSNRFIYQKRALKN